MTVEENTPAPGAERETQGRPGGVDRSKSRMEWIFNVSAFALIVISVFFVFGGIIVARTLPAASRMGLYVRNIVVQQSLALGGLFLMVGLAMKLYAALVVVASCGWGLSLSKRSAWFLKIASVTFTVATAAVVLGSAFFQGKQLGRLAAMAKPGRAMFLRQAADSVSIQSLGIASFFLLLGLFSLIHLLHLRLTAQRQSTS